MDELAGVEVYEGGACADEVEREACAVCGCGFMETFSQGIQCLGQWVGPVLIEPVDELGVFGG